MAIRILITDDHPIVREGLRIILGTCQDMMVIVDPDFETAV